MLGPDLKVIDLSNYKKLIEDMKESNLPDDNAGWFGYIRETLSEDDYLDFLEASVFPDCYDKADEVIKDIVDGYHEKVYGTH